MKHIAENKFMESFLMSKLWNKFISFAQLNKIMSSTSRR